MLIRIIWVVPKQISLVHVSLGPLLSQVNIKIITDNLTFFLDILCNLYLAKTFQWYISPQTTWETTWPDCMLRCIMGKIYFFAIESIIWHCYPYLVKWYRSLVEATNVISNTTSKLMGQLGLICLHFQKYVTKTILLFNDNIALIQIYCNAFTTCIYITICELRISYFN